jgi:hypothetical protein
LTSFIDGGRESGCCFSDEIMVAPVQELVLIREMRLRCPGNWFEFRMELVSSPQ